MSLRETGCFGFGSFFLSADPAGRERKDAVLKRSYLHMLIFIKKYSAYKTATLRFAKGGPALKKLKN